MQMVEIRVTIFVLLLYFSFSGCRPTLTCINLLKDKMNNACLYIDIYYLWNNFNMFMLWSYSVKRGI